MLENLRRLSASLHHHSFVSRNKVYVGLPAPALAPHFARHLDSFVMTLRFSAVYQDLVPRQVHRDTKRSTLYRDWQKMCHPDADANLLNRRAVRRQSACILPYSHRLTIYRDNYISRFYYISDHFLSNFILTDNFQPLSWTQPTGQLYRTLRNPARMPGLKALRRLTQKMQIVF
jgi:hypothetical protein